LNGLGFTFADIGDDDGRVGDRGAGGVRGSSHDASSYGLGVYLRETYQQEDEEQTAAEKILTNILRGARTLMSV